MDLLDADASAECPLIGLHERLPDVVGFGLFEGDTCGHACFDDVSVIEDNSECGKLIRGYLGLAHSVVLHRLRSVSSIVSLAEEETPL